MVDEPSIGEEPQESDSADAPRSLADAADEKLDPMVSEQHDVPDPEDVQTREG